MQNNNQLDPQTSKYKITLQQSQNGQLQQPNHYLQAQILNDRANRIYQLSTHNNLPENMCSKLKSIRTLLGYSNSSSKILPTQQNNLQKFEKEKKKKDSIKRLIQAINSKYDSSSIGLNNHSNIQSQIEQYYTLDPQKKQFEEYSKTNLKYMKSFLPHKLVESPKNSSVKKSVHKNKYRTLIQREKIDNKRLSARLSILSLNHHDHEIQIFPIINSSRSDHNYSVLQRKDFNQIKETRKIVQQEKLISFITLQKVQNVRRLREIDYRGKNTQREKLKEYRQSILLKKKKQTSDKKDMKNLSRYLFPIIKKYTSF